MAKYAMPMSRYLRDQQATGQLQKLKVANKLSRAADTILPGWDRDTITPGGRPRLASKA